MKLIVGLGNPGKKYKNTRHNVGHMIIDQCAKQYQVSMKLDTRFDGEISQIMLHDEKALLLKPTTYMNLSGQSILKTIQYYNIAIEDILVFVDDVNLDTGRLRLREFGGHGGHNGLRNIVGLLHSNQFKRVRIGVDNNTSMPLDKYVLDTFNKEETIIIDLAISKCLNIIDDYMKQVPFSDIMNEYKIQK